jgi:hypothetical protein
MELNTKHIRFSINMSFLRNLKLKSLRLIAIIVGVLLIGAIVVSYALNREPRYEGRTLTEWLRDFNQPKHRSVTEPDAATQIQAAKTAVRKIGVRAIPVLLKKLTAHDTTLERRLKSWANSLPLIKFHFTDPDAERHLAMMGFAALGREAVGAGPELAKIAQHPNPITWRYVLTILDEIGLQPEVTLPILLPALKDPDADVRATAATWLAHRYPEAAERAGVYQMFPALKPRIMDGGMLPGAL